MTPWLEDPDVTLYHGDCLDVLRELPSGSVHMCATSPPFYGLRDYGTGEWEGGDPGCNHAKPTTTYNQGFNERWGQGGGQLKQEKKSEGQYANLCGKCGARRVDRQIGLEETPDQWVERLVAVFREVRRVLRNDGTLWVEIGDSYCGPAPGNPDLAAAPREGGKFRVPSRAAVDARGSYQTLPKKGRLADVKQKDLMGQPWLLAFALRADGWWLRSEIIWARPKPMPESVTDRPTKSHSTVFLLSKQPRYFYDADAIRQPATGHSWKTDELGTKSAQRINGEKPQSFRAYQPTSANARSVWTIPTEPTPFAHFATWPQALVRRMIQAGSPEGGTVLDPFAGSGTTNLVARNHGRHSIGIELNEQYLRLAATRLQQLSLLA